MSGPVLRHTVIEGDKVKLRCEQGLGSRTREEIEGTLTYGRQYKCTAIGPVRVFEIPAMPVAGYPEMVYIVTTLTKD